MSCPCGGIGSRVDTRLANNRIDKFTQSNKLKILDAIVRTLQPGQQEERQLRYTTAQFFDLMNGLRVINPTPGSVKFYFATASKRSPYTDPYLQNGQANKFTLIFAGADGDGNDTGDYYIADSTGSKILSIPSADIPRVADYWVKAFRYGKANALENDPDKPTNRNYEETKTLLYDFRDFLDWECLIQCSQRPGSPLPEAKFVQFVLSAYLEAKDNNGREETVNGQPIGYQLGLIMRLLDQNGNVIDLDQYEWFMEKQKELAEEQKKTHTKATLLLSDYDTGLPCPPATYCLTSGLG